MIIDFPVTNSVEYQLNLNSSSLQARLTGTMGDDTHYEEEFVFKGKNRPMPFEMEQFALSIGLTLPLPHFFLIPFEHPSLFSFDKSKQVRFQQMEWLGDALLQFLISDWLLKKFPLETESQLSRRRTLIVREDTLAAWAKSLHMESVIKARGEITNGILGDVVEVLVGQIYVNMGIKACNAMCVAIGEFESTHANTTHFNLKSLLQDWCIAALGTVPKYEMIRQSGASHQPVFTCRVTLVDQNQLFTISHEGEGLTKQSAEEKAASLFFSTKTVVLPEMPPMLTNPKGKLQERLGGGAFGTTLEYKLLPEIGPVNAPFCVELGKITAYGSTRREAEAFAALARLRELDGNDELKRPPVIPSFSTPSFANYGESTTPPSPSEIFPTSALAGLKLEDDEIQSVSSSASSSVNGNNPKGKLNELLVKESKLADYRLVGQSGPDHAPLFESQVHIGHLMWSGTGRTKRQAEEAAALKALSSYVPSPVVKDTLPAYGGNPKGYLQERVVKVHNAMPCYRECPTPPMGKFSFEVSVNGIVQGRGEGSSKKEAQNNAAQQAILSLNL